MKSSFEKLGGPTVFKICKRLLSKNTDINDFDELEGEVSKICKIFNIDMTTTNTSYIKEFIRLNEDKLNNNDTTDIKLPTLKVYSVPYYIIETIVERQELVQNYSTYDDDTSNISDTIIELESDDRFDIWAGNENPYRSRDFIDSELNSWGVRADEIIQIK